VNRLAPRARAAALVGLLLVGCTRPGPPPAGWTGEVVGVADGDTLTVLRDRTPVKIRLAEIDCPERGQPFGQRAKQHAADLAFGKRVRVAEQSRDRYGRTVAEVFLEDGRSLNRELVQVGLAWQYRRYSTSPSLAALEGSAREARRGLWGDPQPVPPWEWRAAARSPDRHPRLRPGSAAEEERDRVGREVQQQVGVDLEDQPRDAPERDQGPEAVAPLEDAKAGGGVVVPGVEA